MHVTSDVTAVSDIDEQHTCRCPYHQHLVDYYAQLGYDDVVIRDMSDIYTADFNKQIPEHRRLVLVYEYRDSIRRDVLDAIYCGIDCKASYVHIWIHGVNAHYQHEDYKSAYEFERAFNHHTIAVVDINDWYQRRLSIRAVLCPKGDMYMSDDFVDMFVRTDIALL